MNLIGYLAGPIAACSNEECNEWRDKLTQELPNIEWLNPMKRDFREEDNRFDGYEAFIVEGDKADIKKSDFIVVYPWKPGWGTAMEILYAYDNYIPVLVVKSSKDQSLSPWIKYHATKIYDSFDEIVASLKRNAIEIEQVNV